MKGLFFGLGSDSKTFLGPTYVDNQLWFWKYSPNFLFFLDLFCTFLGPLRLFFGPLGLLFWVGGSGSKTFLLPTYEVNQLWFGKNSPNFLLLLWPNLGPFLPFLGLWGLFSGLRSGSKTFTVQLGLSLTMILPSDVELSRPQCTF